MATMLESMLVWLAVVLETLAFAGVLFGLCAIVALADKVVRARPATAPVRRAIRLQPRLWA